MSKDKEMAKSLKLSLTSMPKLKAPSISGSPKMPAQPAGGPAAPKAAVSTAVKTPKAKKPPDAFGKPSLMIKNEESVGPKHPSICKLRDFLDNRKTRK